MDIVNGVFIDEEELFILAYSHLNSNNLEKWDIINNFYT